jgi:hypothetical protein
MALKKKITKTAFEKLDDGIKAFYKEADDGYHLDIEDDKSNDDIAKLERAKDREAAAAKELREKNRELEEKLASFTNDDARKRGDIEALEKSWKDKLDKRERELNEKLVAKDAFIKDVLVQDKAENLATKISTVPNVMKRVIQDRLHVDMSGDKPVLRVLDTDGKASALSLADLEKEIVANAEYAPIIIGSKASGGGAGTDARRGKSGAIPPTDEKVDYAKLTPQEHAELLKQRKAAQQTM